VSALLYDEATNVGANSNTTADVRSMAPLNVLLSVFCPKKFLHIH